MPITVRHQRRGYGFNPMEFSIVAAQYLEHQEYFRNLAPASLRCMRSELRRFAGWTGITMISEVTTETVQTFFMIGLTKHAWSVRTLATNRYTLAPFFTWCVARGHLSSNPIDAIPHPIIPKKIPPKLTKEQALRLIDVSFTMPYRRDFLRYRNRAMFAMCLYAGLRKSELLAVQMEDVDIRHMNIVVRCGKGRKDRMIPMSTTLRTILREYITERTAMKVTVPQLFCNATGRRPLHYNSFNKHMVKIAGIAHIRFTLHALRHTFATLLFEAGCDLPSLSSMLGHARIDTTMIYITTSVEHLRVQMSKHPLN